MENESQMTNNIDPLTEEQKMEGNATKKSVNREVKILVAVIGAVFILIVVIVIALFCLIRKPILPSSKQGDENLMYGIMVEGDFATFQSIGILSLDDLKQEIIVDGPNGFSPLLMRPEACQSYISPDQKSFVGNSPTEILLYKLGNSEPLYEIDSYPPFGIFHNFSPDGKYFSYPSWDLQSSDFVLNILDLNQGNLYSQVGLIYGIFMPNSEQAISFNLDSSGQNIIAIEQVDFLNNQTTPLLDIDLSFDDIKYIPPFLTKDGKLLFYVDGNTLMSFSLLEREKKPIYQFGSIDKAWAPWAFPLCQSDKIAIVDGMNPEVADFYLYSPQNDYLEKITQGSSIELYHVDQRYYANEPRIMLSPDEMRIAYAGGQDVTELRIAELGGGEVIPLSDNAHSFSFRFSPDNERIAYIQFEEPSFENPYSQYYGELYITDIHGGERYLLENNVISFEFIMNGKYIVYSKSENPEDDFSNSSVWRIGIDGSEKVHLFNEEGTFVFIQVP
jgi:hypothetical protein